MSNVLIVASGYSDLDSQVVEQYTQNGLEFQQVQTKREIFRGLPHAAAITFTNDYDIADYNCEVAERVPSMIEMVRAFSEMPIHVFMRSDIFSEMQEGLAKHEEGFRGRTQEIFDGVRASEPDNIGCLIGKFLALNSYLRIYDLSKKDRNMELRIVGKAKENIPVSYNKWGVAYFGTGDLMTAAFLAYGDLELDELVSRYKGEIDFESIRSNTEYDSVVGYLNCDNAARVDISRFHEGEPNYRITGLSYGNIILELLDYIIDEFKMVVDPRSGEEQLLAKSIKALQIIQNELSSHGCEMRRKKLCRMLFRQLE